MFGSKILEVAIGVVFIFMLVSIICSAMRESIEAWLKTRAAYLEYGIRELLHDKKATGLAKSFFNHPLIYGLFSQKYKPGETVKRPGLLANGGTLPSYIPSKNFAQVLMDIAARGPETNAVSSDPGAPVMSIESIRRNVLNINNPSVQRVLLMAIDSAQGDLNKAQANLEAWFDSGMDRVSGWYKRSTQWIIFWIGLAVAIGMNVNTITIADYLYRNDSVRTALIARIETESKDSTLPNDAKKEAMNKLESLGLPIGWTAGIGGARREEGPGTMGFWQYVGLSIPGWLLTALAATMGAPFWFDLLNKLMVIRSTVKPHEKSPEESSEDHQEKPQPTPPPVAPAPNVVAVVGGVPAPVPIPSEADIQSPMDNESGVDGCDVEVETPTLDIDLPESKGGVS